MYLLFLLEERDMLPTRGLGSPGPELRPPPRPRVPTGGPLTLTASATPQHKPAREVTFAARWPERWQAGIAGAGPQGRGQADPAKTDHSPTTGVSLHQHQARSRAPRGSVASTARPCPDPRTASAEQHCEEASTRKPWDARWRGETADMHRV